jgi:hypothetical protein
MMPKLDRELCVVKILTQKCQVGQSFRKRGCKDKHGHRRSICLTLDNLEKVGRENLCKKFV